MNHKSVLATTYGTIGFILLAGMVGSAAGVYASLLSDGWDMLPSWTAVVCSPLIVVGFAMLLYGWLRGAPVAPSSLIRVLVILLVVFSCIALLGASNLAQTGESDSQFGRMLPISNIPGTLFPPLVVVGVLIFLVECAGPLIELRQQLSEKQ